MIQSFFSVVQTDGLGLFVIKQFINLMEQAGVYTTVFQMIMFGEWNLLSLEAIYIYLQASHRVDNESVNNTSPDLLENMM